MCSIISGSKSSEVTHEMGKVPYNPIYLHCCNQARPSPVNSTHLQSLAMTSTTETTAPSASHDMNKLFLRGAKAETSFGDFRDDLQRDGVAVVKGAIPRERADKYAEQMFQWLEDL